VFAISLSIGRGRAEAAKLESREKEEEGEWQQQYQCINFFYYSLLFDSASSSSITKFANKM
jgi:hypothetical protein